jgi:hypothetical protein
MLRLKVAKWVLVLLGHEDGRRESGEDREGEEVADHLDHHEPREVGLEPIFKMGYLVTVRHIREMAYGTTHKK